MSICGLKQGQGIPSVPSNKRSKTEVNPRSRLLAALNRYSRSEALAELLSDRYLGGQPSRFKLWVTPETLGNELLIHLDRQSKARIGKEKGECAADTIARHLEQEKEKNRERVRLYVQEMKSKDLLFFRVDIGLPHRGSRGGVRKYRGSERGRKEITWLRDTGVIRNKRHARFFGSVYYGSPNSYIAVPADKVRGVEGLRRQSAEFDKQVCLGNLLGRIDGGLPPEELTVQLNTAFEKAVENLAGQAGIQDIRKDFEKAAAEKLACEPGDIRKKISGPRL